MSPLDRLPRWARLAAYCNDAVARNNRIIIGGKFCIFGTVKARDDATCNIPGQACIWRTPIQDMTIDTFMDTSGKGWSWANRSGYSQQMDRIAINGQFCPKFSIWVGRR